MQELESRIVQLENLVHNVLAYESRPERLAASAAPTGRPCETDGCERRIPDGQPARITRCYPCYRTARVTGTAGTATSGTRRGQRFVKHARASSEIVEGTIKILSKDGSGALVERASDSVWVNAPRGRQITVPIGTVIRVYVDDRGVISPEAPPKRGKRSMAPPPASTAPRGQRPNFDGEHAATYVKVAKDASKRLAMFHNNALLNGWKDGKNAGIGEWLSCTVPVFEDVLTLAAGAAVKLIVQDGMVVIMTSVARMPRASAPKDAVKASRRRAALSGSAA